MRRWFSGGWVDTGVSATTRKFRLAGVKRNNQTPRVYDLATVRRLELGQDQNPWVVELDRRLLHGVHTPLFFPTKSLALAVAAEWERQGPKLKPSTMPLTSLCSFAVDGLADPEDCKRAIDKLWTFIWTDTACYRNSESSELREKQERILNPLLDWVDSKWGVRLVTTRLVEPLKHDSGEIDVFKQESIKGLSQYQLAALDALVKSTKSYVIPMAFLHGHITAEETYIASRIEEDLQVLKWGEVEGGHDLDQAYTKVKIYSASLLMQLLEDRD